MPTIEVCAAVSDDSAADSDSDTTASSPLASTTPTTTADACFGGDEDGEDDAADAADAADAPAASIATDTAPRETIAAVLALLNAIGIAPRDPVLGGTTHSKKEQHENTRAYRVSLQIIMMLVPKFKRGLFKSGTTKRLTMNHIVAGLHKFGGTFGFDELGAGVMSVASPPPSDLLAELKDGTVVVSIYPTKFGCRRRRAYLSNALPSAVALGVLTQPIKTDTDGSAIQPQGTAKYVQNLGKFKFKSTSGIFGQFEGKKLSELLDPNVSVAGLVDTMRSSPSPSGETPSGAGINSCTHNYTTTCVDTDTEVCDLCGCHVQDKDKDRRKGKSDCLWTLTQLYAPVSDSTTMDDTPDNTTGNPSANTDTTGNSSANGSSSRKRQLAFGSDDLLTGSQEELITVYDAIKTLAGPEHAHLYLSHGKAIAQANDRHRKATKIDPNKVRRVDKTVLARIQFMAAAPPTGGITRDTIENQKSRVFFATDFAKAHAELTTPTAASTPTPTASAAYPELSSILHKCTDADNVGTLLDRLEVEGMTTTRDLQLFCSVTGENALRDLRTILDLNAAEATKVIAMLLLGHTG